MFLFHRADDQYVLNEYYFINLIITQKIIISLLHIIHKENQFEFIKHSNVLSTDFNGILLKKFFIQEH